MYWTLHVLVTLPWSKVFQDHNIIIMLLIVATKFRESFSCGFQSTFAVFIHFATLHFYFTLTLCTATCRKLLYILAIVFQSLVCVCELILQVVRISHVLLCFCNLFCAVVQFKISVLNRYTNSWLLVHTYTHIYTYIPYEKLQCFYCGICC